MNKFLLSIASLALASIPAFAQTATPQVPDVVEGSFHCFRAVPVNMIPAEKAPRRSAPLRAPKLTDHKWDNADGHDIREVKTQGSLDVLVVLVQFQDTKLTKGDANYINNMLNGDNFTENGAVGSAAAFYRFASAGQFTPNFNLVGPITLSKSMREYYAPSHPAENVIYAPTTMVEEAVKAIDDQVDFSKYDSNGDGYVDFVYVFYAGQAESNKIWPHAFTLTGGVGAPVELDGVLVDRYATSAEINHFGKLSGIGTFCHEFGHVLGYPDLYDTLNNGQVSKCFTPGPYSLMDAGEYNNDEQTPPVFSIYEQYALEWTKPVEITGSASLTLLPQTARRFGYKVPTKRRPTDYFLFEARAPHSYDRYLDGHGMLVWHIDYAAELWENNAPNNAPTHQRIDIEEADGTQESTSRPGDVFPGSTGAHEFESVTNPAFADWSDNSTGFEINSIVRYPDGCVSFNVEADSGEKMPGADLSPIIADVRATTSTSATISWQPVAGASEYLVSVYDLAEFDGVLITKYVDGYDFRSVGEATSTEISGLQPGKNYGAYVYALTDVNAARLQYPLEFATVSSTDFADAVTSLHAFADNGVVSIYWDEVADADSYRLSIAVPEASQTTESRNIDFADKTLPSGWKTNGAYDDRDKYCGQAAPSLRLAVASQYIASESFADEVSNISFWGRTLYGDPSSINIYAVGANGNRRLVKTIDNPENAGTNYSIDFPEGARAFQIVFYTTATGESFFIDDLEVSLHKQYNYTPVNATVTYTGKTSANVEGLDADRSYAAYVTPMRGETAGMRSNVLLFTPSKAHSGVNEIQSAPEVTFAIDNGTVFASDANADFSVYSIDGTLIAKATGSFTLPAKGIYIVRAGADVTKLLW
ncbi:MAG: M6 family metalloprotease domain-containing protein [Muribaculum sp.]|nr:M6 family metalloprotease domain-containing protein [Muribaculum sp.]